MRTDLKKLHNVLFTLAILPLAACPAGDDSDSGNDTAGTAGTAVTAADDDDGGSALTAADDDDDGGPSTGADTGATAGDTVEPDSSGGGTTGGGGGGFCGQTCTTADDCPVPADYECTDGFCEFTGTLPDPCDPAVCPEAAGFGCVQIDGNDACAFLCPNGDECDIAMLNCTGEADGGEAFCEADPCVEGDPCEIAGVGQYGTCTDGACSCTEDTECTIDGQACHP